MINLPDGFILLQNHNGKPLYAACLDGGRFHGWLMSKHPDGQWVSNRKLESWEVMQAEDQRDDEIVHETSAPAAQASATIQAAPIGMHAAADLIDAKAQKYLDDHADTENDTGSVVFHYGEAGRDYHSTLVELAEELRLAATIQEPIMVAEPYAEGEAFYRKGGEPVCPYPQDSDQCFQWMRGYVAASQAAPMVADPASVALTYPCWSCKKPYTLDQRSYADGRCPHCDVDIDLDLEMDDEADDATVKAVPSEALAYRVGWFWSSANPDRAVRCLAEGKQIAEYEKRDDFIYWCDAAPLADKTDGAVEVSKRTHSARRFEADPMCNETLLAPGTTEVHDE